MAKKRGITDTRKFHKFFYENLIFVKIQYMKKSF